MSTDPVANGVPVATPTVTATPTATAPATATPTATPTAPAEKPKFSWLQPHPIFVIILVGADEQPFGVQKDFLCARSEFYRNYFAEKHGEETLEHIVKLPETTKEVFGLAQNFLYSGDVVSDVKNMPSYEALVGLWNLGHKLVIDGLCDKALHAMTECRRLTERIPATPLLIQVWRDTPEGSSIRVLLLSWAAEYMRSSAARAEFAKSLPQEVLSELVVTMSSFDSIASIMEPPVETPAATPPVVPEKNVHYLEGVSDEEALKNTKRGRRTSGISNGAARTPQEQSANRKAARASLPKQQKHRSSVAYLEGRTFTPQQKMDFCSDLLTRMLSGPGFWTRLVGPFREPVEPTEDGVPDYFDKVKRPMDLSTVKAKMDRKEYKTDEEFVQDVRQIFDNCFRYWKKGDPMWNAGEKLQKTFEEKYSNMHKWIAKMGGEEE